MNAAEPATATPPTGMAPARPRIQTLSDMVFGLALSLGALALISQTPTDPAHLYFTLVVFAFNFLILVQVWYRYSAIMAVLRIETAALVDLDFLLLFTVAVEPYLLTILAYHALEPVGEAASLVYAFDLAAMNAILAAFMHAVMKRPGPALPASAVRGHRGVRNVLLAFTALFLVSALPVFWTWTVSGFPVRLIVWIATLPAGHLVRWVGR